MSSPNFSLDMLINSGFIKKSLSNQNHYISTTTIPMTNNLGRVVTYHEGLSPIKSHDTLVAWSWR